MFDHGQTLDHLELRKPGARQPAGCERPTDPVTVHRKKKLILAIFESNFVTSVFLVRFSIFLVFWNALFMPNLQIKVSQLLFG